MQYQSECRNALESVVNISKSFQKVFMDAIKLFMAIPDRINFLQMGRYGCFSEQTYRNNFVVNMGAVALRLNRTLNFDPVKLEFIDDEAANRLLDQPMRAPWNI